MKKLVKVMLLCVAFGTMFSCSEDEFDDSGTNSGNGNIGSNAIACPEAIDLGLPSGIKWASFNIGATSPEENGDYYAWGETEQKDNYAWETYKWCSGDSESLTKYCTENRYGTVDDKTVLDMEDDVAHVKLGGDWRLPTDDEAYELASCERERVMLNGVEVYKITGPNGNFIYLPLAGAYWGKSNSLKGIGVGFWTSELSSQDCYAKFEGYNFGGATIVERSWGLSIRPVCGEYSAPIPNYKITVSAEGEGNVSIVGTDENFLIVEIGTDVKVVAIPNEGYEFAAWYDGSTKVSTEQTYTFTVNGNINLVAKFKRPLDPNGHEYVDLDLPSGIKWASCNVGANSPEEYGGYYAWGETEEKENYDWSTYKWCDGSSNTITKYCYKGAYGIVDNRRVLELEDDVAHVKWGGSWRMPTQDELQELFRECDLEWTTLNGVYGVNVIAPNGNSIFLPAAGYRYGTDYYNRGSFGFYWSTTLNIGPYAEYLRFNSDSYNWYDYGRYVGFCVRPVAE